MSSGRIAVAGAGLGALSAAERLRERGWTGEIVIVGDEPRRPYNRTPLSKQLLAGTRQPAELRLAAHRDVDATWVLGTSAVALDPHQRSLHLGDGRRLDFDGLVIATGTTPRRPGGIPFGRRVHTVRTLDDARALDAALGRARHVVVVGGGFIGCEVACAARDRALTVSLIEPREALLTGPLGPTVAATVTEQHAKAGVRLHLGTTVTRWEETGRGLRLHLSDGTVLKADAAVVAVGTEPRTDWLQASGVQLADGVSCDPTCHVIGPDGRALDGIVAAGDAATWPNLRFDAVPRRVEHWINAIEMGQHAADSLLAGPTAAAPFTPVPRFWSHQHGLRIQSAGMPALGTATVPLTGAPKSGRYVLGYTRPDQHGTEILVGAVALDAPRALIAYRDQIGLPLARRRAA
ncbi:FAD-dependent oxidoreductase [Kitasatospora sp. RB6PN24]|uniref:NAD(P)/FAD-dependent oxidoreductase n=1 Tax=Kitasatospora humi TaxID=2893891 RepID=UPI001E608BFD|nr:FAD-dependent oxidoreductase [Kitasatospora humi]MCC9311576.1 FAD-dependent oxidoreductase [Kitasatospora humi]